MSQENPWAWWQAALAGNIGPMHEGQPEQGYYRTRFKGGQWEPVALWRGEDGEWLARRGDRMVDDAGDLWNFCRTHPVTVEAWEKAINGGGWDDEPPAPAIGHNLPSDPFEALLLEYQAEKEQAEAFLKLPIKTQADADRAAIWSKRLSTIAKKATDLHKVEKQPSLDESRRIDDKWRDLKDSPADLSKRLKRHMDVFLQEQQRLELERQRKAREEAARIQREADAARIAAEQASAKNDNAASDAAAEAERLAKQAADAERDAQARNASAGRTGARVALRTFVFAEITDFEKLLLALKDRPEIKEVVETLANRAARSGVELAGMAIRSEQRAA
jgi:hypothetical protein